MGAGWVVLPLPSGPSYAPKDGGWRESYALEVASREHEGREEIDQQEARVALLDEASRVAPEKANLHRIAGQAYWDIFQTEQAKLENRQQLRDVVRLLLALQVSPGLPPFQGILAAFPSCRTIDSFPPFRTEGEEGRLVRCYLLPSLRHYLVARDLCPLMAKPQIRIADCREWLTAGDDRGSYIRRAKRTLSTNPELWYLAGRLELRDGQEVEAWSSWKRSLELSRQYLPQILDGAHARLTDDDLIQQVLPDQPEIHLAAAAHLHPQPDDEERRPFWKASAYPARIFPESYRGRVSPLGRDRNFAWRHCRGDQCLRGGAAPPTARNRLALRVCGVTVQSRSPQRRPARGAAHPRVEAGRCRGAAYTRKDWREANADGIEWRRGVR